MAKPYSLRRSRKLFYKFHSHYKLAWKRLSPNDLSRVEGDLEALDKALLGRNREEASNRAKSLETYAPHLLRKHPVRRLIEFVVGLALALLAAIVIRQMWFEPMEIPSGSMRPHFQELDRLLVTKTPFGLNIPMTPKHFFFSPDRVKRTGVFVFTSEDMDIPDQDTRYLGIPSKKRLIKRVMGKPGDTLYFYGGKIYGMDAKGRDLSELRENRWVDEVTTIPFIHFQGIPERTGQTLLFKQMNAPLGRLSLASRKAEIWEGGGWVPERPSLTYGSLWGIDNYAMARLLSPQQAARFGQKGESYLLQLAHHPTLTGGFQTQTSHLPLTEAHLEALMRHMTTSRFLVKGGRAYPEAHPNLPLTLRVPFPSVPDGRYQFTDGTAYKVAFSGLLIPLERDHPLYSEEPAHIQRLFNLGIDFNTSLEPNRFEAPYPNRYAFYRDGDLYLLAHPIFTSEDPSLKAFIAAEEERASASLPYHPFVDQGPPLQNGEIDRAKLKKLGLRVPEKGYLALGDNYANSGDSRVFGFVPEDNIRGAPSFIFWPAGKRWGVPFMPPNPWLTPAGIVVWGIALLILIGWLLWSRRESRRSHFKRLILKN
ncbi:MAG: signal peptidase I [Parachlamydiales bacterium]